MSEYTAPDPRDPSKAAFLGGRVLRGEPPQEVFLEAKRGYEILERYPNSLRAEGIRENLSKEAIRQLRILPDDAKLEWHVSTERGATAIRDTIEELSIERGLDVDQIAVIAAEPV